MLKALVVLIKHLIGTTINGRFDGFMSINHFTRTLIQIQLKNNAQRELFSHDEVSNLSYARMVYLYGRPGLAHDHMDISADQLRNDVHPVWKPVGGDCSGS